MNAAQLIPAMLQQFKNEIKPFKGAADTPENRDAAAQIIAHHAARLQLADLEMSNDQARATLANAYRQL